MNTNINILLSTLPGLELPPTLCLQVSRQSNTCQLLSLIATYVTPSTAAATPRLCITTTNHREVFPSSVTTLADLVDSTCVDDAAPSFLTLRLSALLRGGKGGFGSQLRAAGGRMSSRKKRQNAELATGSARNLDGRRLRTITEAKNLATYLATKPEMDRRQKEERRKRWEQVIELAEQREADMKAGKGTDGRRKGLSEEWIEEKEDVSENVKNAVNLAMSAGHAAVDQEQNGSGQSASNSEDEDSGNEDTMELDEDDMAKLTREAEAGDADAIWVLKNKLKIPTSFLPKQKIQHRKFAGFDDDDDDENDDESSEEDTGDQEVDVTANTQEKGKSTEHDS